MRLDILIPVYEPIDGWAEDLIVQYRILLSRLPESVKTQLIIVNDGSKKNIEKDGDYIKSIIPETLWISYPENHGKGYALREAARHSDGDIIMYTDYDFPYTFGSMARMIEKLLTSEADAVVGNRDDSYYAHISPRRRRISIFLKSVNRILFSLPTNDTQCGLKAFKA